MKRLTCELCNSTNLIKTDGVFVCQSCGCKYTVEEAKKIFKKIGISCTNPEMKKNAREYLRNNMMAFEILYGDGYYYFGLCGRIAEGTERGSFDFVLLNPYDAKENKFGSMVSKIHTNLFIKGCQMSFGFKPIKGWYYKK